MLGRTPKSLVHCDEPNIIKSNSMIPRFFKLCIPISLNELIWIVYMMNFAFVESKFLSRFALN